MRVDTKAGMARGKIGDTLFDVPVIPKIIIERLHEAAEVPKYASEGDSGMDVYASKNMLLFPGATKQLMELGFKMEIPKHPFHDLGYRWECEERPRSGLSLKTTLRIANSPGTIDNFYVGEVGAVLFNTAPFTTVTVGHVHDLSGKRVDANEIRDLGIIVEDGEGFMRGTLLVRKGDRIAQIVFNQVIRPLEIVEGKVNPDHGRPEGFGSSGVR